MAKKVTFGLRNEKILKAKLRRDNTWPSTPNKTCASCRFFGRDYEMSGFTGLMYPCKKSSERIADNPGLTHCMFGATVLYEYQNREKCKYFEGDNAKETE